MKKISLLLASLCALFLVACSNQKQADGKLNIVTTFYPVYEFTKQVAGDTANVELPSVLAQNPMNMNRLPRQLPKSKTQIPSFMKMKTWKHGYLNC